MTTRHSDSHTQFDSSKEINFDIRIAKKHENSYLPKKFGLGTDTECGQNFSLLDTRMYLWFAEQCLLKGKKGEALRTYEALREQDPLSLEKWVHAVEVLIAQGKQDEARTTLEKLTTALPIYETLNSLLE